ncbi:hypothetical protein BDY19DRAFT_940933 [Irpex rosettiformis]|uniref:Uncharacterized protein n=1 Tax=Irpex rosettiformis TaxID=378272 RepID=A0ACB8U665_9APHY|nr:hypothetical protein BDY19DRAFT_940933 [Irpex rosettiformis]
MSTYDVYVANIAAATTQQHLQDFFTFCGKIASVDFDESARTATIHFEKPSAARTALMLNGGTLDGATLSVTSPTEHHDQESHESHHERPIDQTDKPRAGIAAEYLAKGYILSDQILQRAIELDRQRGISQRFLGYIHSLDSSLGQKALGPDKTISGLVVEKVNQAQAQAKSIDEQRGISSKAGDYYSRALASPFGQKVLSFYTTTSKQVLDIHEEARRIASQHPSDASAPSVDPAVHSTDKPLDADEAKQDD